MYGLSKFLLALWRFSFICPVVKHRAADTYRFSRCFYMFNLIMLTVFVGQSVWAVISDVTFGRTLRIKSTTTTVVTVLQTVLMAMLCVLAVCGSAGRHETMLEIERRLRRVDKALGSLPDQPIVRFGVMLLTCNTALYILDAYAWYRIDQPITAYWVFYVYEHISVASLLLYAQITWCIGQRFHRINSQIEYKLRECIKNATKKQMNPTRQPMVFVNNYTDINTVSIAKLQELHDSLCSCIKMVNDKFGWQLFVTLFCNCVHLIVTSNLMLVELFFPAEANANTDIYFKCIQVIWVLIHISHLLLIVLPPSYATKKAERTAVIICKHLSMSLEQDDMKQLEMFVLQSHKEIINFSACGVMSLHRSTITTIVGTAITYLSILIQFKNSA
ncbi:gustatory receptor for sugar taste 43a-like [Adelges cooleyi]|uniref:gustatory receptor for sugar taste 43a-like n=1 Tax=Adelges cooleyi TaxID=133065 RepID=UPI00217F7CB7|nr:gustatory receptor for sugar taste 43a-like [Adelges cooleyi]